MGASDLGAAQARAPLSRPLPPVCFPCPSSRLCGRRSERGENPPCPCPRVRVSACPQGEEPPEDDLAALEQRLSAARPPPDVLRMARAELAKLRRANDNAPWYGSSKTWVEWVAHLPWAQDSDPAKAAPTLRAARERLDEEHFGLDKARRDGPSRPRAAAAAGARGDRPRSPGAGGSDVIPPAFVCPPCPQIKQRIVEYLAVRRLRPDARPPILCFLGPPGAPPLTSPHFLPLPRAASSASPH